MSRLTLRLPETLHHQLAAQAQEEGVSLNQYIVYALTRQLTRATVQVLSEDAVGQQRVQFTTLLRDLEQISRQTLVATLADREHVEPEPGLTPEVITRIRTRLAGASPGEEHANNY
jgi:hypothetical protein